MPEAQMEPVSRWDALRFRLLVTLAKRLILLRDSFVMRKAVTERLADAASAMTPIHVMSGGRRLEARLAIPPTAPIASVLVLHGIGERLDYWAEAQQVLAARGIASLIVAFSGYGRSQGVITPVNLRQDVIAAYATMRERLPEVKGHFVLGLSLGTGIGIDALPALAPPPAGIILCEPFSSFREAGVAVCRTLPILRHLAPALSRLVPDLYRTAVSVRSLGSPLLLVHSDADELFPAAMARTIFDAAKLDSDASVELHVLHGFAHNDAYLRPHSEYWQPILAFVERETRRSATPHGRQSRAIE